MAESTLCLFCGRKPMTRPRGLCWKCYETPGVRGGFPKDPASNQPDDMHEPTEAELEALIAAQRPTMPFERYEENEPDPISPLERRLVRGFR